ncbi:MAG: DUF819 family protein, partial [Pseudomonadales bacterium]
MINSDQEFLIWACLFAIAALGFIGDRSGGPIRNFGPAVVMVVGMAASNLGVLPQQSPSYTAVWNLFIPMLIPLFLFAADLREIWVEARRLLLVFVIAVTGTLVGVFGALWLIPLPEEAGRLSAVFGATYIGGSSNFAAVANALDFQSHPLMAPALAADAIISVTYLLVLITLSGMPRLVGRFVPHHERKASRDDTEAASSVGEGGVISPLSATIALALSALICGLSEMFSNVIDPILVTTVITVALVTSFPSVKQKVVGHYDIGLVMIYIMFTLIGISSDLGVLIGSGLYLVLFCATIVFIHFTLVMVAAKLLGF